MALFDLLIVLAMLGAAFLYSSVGHGGASAYLAILALAGIAPAQMRPAALIMNVVVAGLALVHFHRKGWFRWSLFWPFAVTAVPLAFLGGKISLPTQTYKIMVGIVLAFAALRLFWAPGQTSHTDGRPLNRWIALGAGSGIGLLSGLTGVGGGIFLSPLLVLLRWAAVKVAAAVSAAFVLANSLSGLLALSGNLTLPAHLWWWLGAVVIGGWTGSWLGSSRFHSPVLLRLLGVVLLVAAGKLMFF